VLELDLARLGTEVEGVWEALIPRLSEASVVPGQLTDVGMSGDRPTSVATADLATVTMAVSPRLHPIETSRVVLSLSEVLSLLVQAGATLGRGEQLPETVSPWPLLGPAAAAPHTGEVLVSRDMLLASCQRVLNEMRSRRVPTTISLSDYVVTPCAYLVALANALGPKAERGPLRVPPGPLPQFDAARRDVRQAAAAAATAWPREPDRRLITQAVLAQCWTARPPAASGNSAR
jgi:hypothetical protein